jgi:pimeloyl-ACP methyl ester carboxylesterase
MVIDAINSQFPELQTRKKILFGYSLGGLLVARAATIDSRIDAVICSGAPFDMLDTGLMQGPSISRWLFRNKHRRIFNFLVTVKSKIDIGVRWAINNGYFTIGGSEPYELLQKMSRYTLKDIHDKVRCPVLVLYGGRDIFVSDGIQEVMFQSAFPNAKSYTLKVFREEDGAAEHCQAGSAEQSVQAVIEWINEQGFVK